MSTTQIIPGFSLTNRLLLYASVLLAPAQFVSGLQNNCPSNIGFLAFNLYSQVKWYQAVRAKRIHALCMILPHFNLVYVFSYMGGITSGTIVTGLCLGVGTAAVLLLNTAVAWISWATNQPEGFGTYRFFFFGWRTLTFRWHTFMLLWQVSDTFLAAGMALVAVFGSIAIPAKDFDDADRKPKDQWLKLIYFKKTDPWRQWLMTLLSIFPGAAVALLVAWPLILWTELLVAGNHVESATDWVSWVSVWLFVAQAGTMIVPPCTAWLGCLRRRR